MLKSLMHDIALAMRARTGLTPGFFIWLAIVALAAVTTFAFLCVAAYQWVSLQLGVIYGGLVMAGVFLCIALIGMLVSALLRRRARERAMLERAARAQAAPWLDPRLLGAAMEAGRAIGWQRLIPLALVGFLAAEWLRSRQRRTDDDGDAG